MGWEVEFGSYSVIQSSLFCQFIVPRLNCCSAQLLFMSACVIMYMWMCKYASKFTACWKSLFLFLSQSLYQIKPPSEAFGVVSSVVNSAAQLYHPFFPSYQHYAYGSPPHTHPQSQDVHYSQNEPVDLTVSKRSSVSSPSSSLSSSSPRATPPSFYERASPVTHPLFSSGSRTESPCGSSQTRQLSPPLALSMPAVRIGVMLYRWCHGAEWKPYSHAIVFTW